MSHIYLVNDYEEMWLSLRSKLEDNKISTSSEALKFMDEFERIAKDQLDKRTAAERNVECLQGVLERITAYLKTVEKK